jgi:hypothetical protein
MTDTDAKQLLAALHSYIRDRLIYLDHAIVTREATPELNLSAIGSHLEDLGGQRELAAILHGFFREDPKIRD